jgi:AcrR family transcriptional regulator
VSAVERGTAESILSAAAELFGERGYKGTTTRAIAERAGVNEVTIFRQFGSKQGLLKGLGELWSKSMAGFTADSTPDPSDVRGTLEVLARMEVRQALSFGAPALRLAFDARSVPEVMAVMGSGPEDNLAGLATYLAARQVAGDLRQDLDPYVMAEAFFALTSTFVMSRQVLGSRLGDHGLDLDDVVLQLLDIYLTGVGLGAKGA